VAAVERLVDPAGRIWGAVESHFERRGELMLPQTSKRYEAAFELIEGTSFADAVRVGRELSLKDATREAVETFGR
jgi:hypothetical protein